MMQDGLRISMMSAPGVRAESERCREGAGERRGRARGDRGIYISRSFSSPHLGPKSWGTLVESGITW